MQRVTYAYGLFSFSFVEGLGVISTTSASCLRWPCLSRSLSFFLSLPLLKACHELGCNLHHLGFLSSVALPVSVTFFFPFTFFFSFTFTFTFFFHFHFDVHVFHVLDLDVHVLDVHVLETYGHVLHSHGHG